MLHSTPCLWATAREAREQLGVSEVTLARWRKSGLLRPGKEWRRKFPSGNSPVLYQVEACQHVMNEAAARSVDLQERALPALDTDKPGQRSTSAAVRRRPGRARR